MNVTYTIRYRRPEALWSVAVMVVREGPDMALAQLQRLRKLGYTISDVSPALPEQDASPPRLPDAA